MIIIDILLYLVHMLRWWNFFLKIHFERRSSFVVAQMFQFPEELHKFRGKFKNTRLYERFVPISHFKI